jgi:hypothetical protein
MAQHRARRRILPLGIAVISIAMLTGCVGDSEMPVPSLLPSASPSPSATAEPDPEFRPDGTAAQNQHFFDFVNSQYQASNGMGDGQTIVDFLVSNGFDKAAMEVTYDSTAIGLVADSIIVSVHIGEECLIGQFSAAQYTGTRAPVLGTGKCLVGDTRQRDPSID